MIVRMSPDKDLAQVDQAWFDSDAGTNTDAIREIDAEAAKYGLVRTREYWLQTFRLPDGRVVRRGFCYRPGPSDTAEHIAERRGTVVAGASSVDIVREMRERE